MSVSIESLSALAAYLPQPLVRLLRDHPNQDWAGYTRRQRASVLFADLVGFTPMTEALTARGREGAEELTGLLDHVFTVLVATCEDYGGVVGKFVGDALTVYWTAERDRDLPNAKLRALICGLALQRQMEEFARVQTTVGPFRLAMRIGVAAGFVDLCVAGDPEVGLEALLLGRPLLAAAQAQRAAKPGEVVAHASVAAEAIGRTRDDMIVVDHPVRPLLRRSLPSLMWDSVTDPDLVAALIAKFLPSALADRILLGQGAFAGELRHVTSAFVGLTEYPEEDRQSIDMGGAISVVQRIVSAAGGRVNRVSMSDKGTMIHLLFGTPTAYEDDAARAIWAARRLWAELTGHFGISAVQVGVATGGVYAGPVGGPTRREYTVMGDAVNLSARLMQVAGPGQVVCDAFTMEEAPGTFVWERLSPVLVKGKSRPVEVWLVSEAENIDRTSPRQGPLVGRRQELETLKRVLERASQGQGQVVSLTGEGGIGKSRLLQAWLMEAFMDDWCVVMGQAAVTGQDVPYLSWRTLAAEMMACSPDADIEQLNEAATRTLKTLSPNLVEHWPLLGDLLGVPLPDTLVTAKMEASQRRQALVQLVISWIKVQTVKTPMLLVLEDAQWADESSVALALELAQMVTALPAKGIRKPGHSKGVVLALVHRSLTPPVSTSWELLAKTVTETIILGELSPEEICELAAHRLGTTSLPDRLVALLVGRTQGHPFFAEELCRMLQEQDVVRVLDGWVQLSPDLSSIAIPTSVEDLIQSRIDRLDEPTRLTMKVAAVLGTEIPFAALLGSYPVSIEPAILRQNLSTLERLGLLLAETVDPAVYRFKHTITQLIAYHSLLEAHRRDLHGRVAGYFEETLGSTPGRTIEILAYHYARSDQQAKAAHYLRLAGEQATRQAAYSAAIDYFNQALERVSATDYTALCTILERREQLWRTLGKLADRRQDLEALEAAAKAGADLLWPARAAFRRAVFAQDQGDYYTADANLQEVISQAAALSDDRMMGLALLERGNILAGWSRYNDALICYEVASELFDQQKLIDLQAEAVRERAEMQRHIGDWVGALVSYEEAEHLAESAGDQAGVALLRVDQAILYTQLGMFEEAERDLIAAWEWAEQVDHRYILMEGGAALGELYWNLERGEDAWPYLLIAHALSEEQDNPHHRARILLVSAALLLDDGKPDKALEGAQEARLLASQIESAECEGQAMALEIEALIQQDLAAAAHGAWAALDWAEKAEETLSSFPLLYLALARAFAASGDQEAAFSMVRQMHSLVANQASRVEPLSLRESFLVNPRINRVIQDMWEKLEPDQRFQ